MIRAAIVQAAPVYLDLEASVERALDWIRRAAREGAGLVAFSETWLPGYPAWLDCTRDVALWDHAPAKRIYARLMENAVAIPGPVTEVLAGAAREHHVVLNMGVHERVEQGAGRGTLYNTMLTFDADGSLRNAHRKIMPTYTERLVWGWGDGASITAHSTAVGRVGGLICWEHWMPPARHVLHASGEDIHVAAWPQVKEMMLVASRHYAFEGRCFVLAAGGIMRARDLPDGLEPVESLAGDPDALVLRGGSAVIGPNGDVLAGPIADEERLLIADLDLSRIAEESMALDVTGHYARPDIFEVKVRT